MFGCASLAGRVARTRKFKRAALISFSAVIRSLPTMLGTAVCELCSESTIAPTRPIENAMAIPMTIRTRFSVSSARFTKGTIVLVSFPGAASDKSANQARSLAFTRKQPQPKRDLRLPLKTRDKEAVSAVAMWPGANRAGLSLEIACGHELHLSEFVMFFCESLNHRLVFFRFERAS